MTFIQRQVGNKVIYGWAIRTATMQSLDWKHRWVIGPYSREVKK